MTSAISTSLATLYQLLPADAGSSQGGHLFCAHKFRDPSFCKLSSYCRYAIGGLAISGKPACGFDQHRLRSAR